MHLDFDCIVWLEQHFIFRVCTLVLFSWVAQPIKKIHKHRLKSITILLNIKSVMKI